MPEINPVKAHMWAYKYDSEMNGINIHADTAAVNGDLLARAGLRCLGAVNFWITEDDANLDADSGGLVVYSPQVTTGNLASDLKLGRRLLRSGTTTKSILKAHLPRLLVDDLGA